MVFTNGYADDLATNLEVVNQLRIICPIVHVLNENAALVRVVAPVARLANIVVATNQLALFFLTYCDKKSYRYIETMRLKWSRLS